MYYEYYHMEDKNKQTNFHSQLRSKLDACMYIKSMMQRSISQKKNNLV